VGREGLGKALQGSQVALSVILPFVSAPLIWFTCRGRYMRVAVRRDGVGAGAGDGAYVGGDAVADAGAEYVQMRNHWVTAGFALVIWGVIVVMNVALLVLVGKGVA
jgi:metal iron transporter